VHTVFQHPRRHYRASRTPPTIVMRHRASLPRLGANYVALAVEHDALPGTRLCQGLSCCVAPIDERDHEHPPIVVEATIGFAIVGALAARCSQSDPCCLFLCDNGRGSLAMTHAYHESRKNRGDSAMAHNGEVEGPDDHAGQAPRAQNVFPRPRRVTTGLSRPPPTIVRRRRHSLKKVITVGAVELAAQHAAVLEISGQTGRGMGHCDRASH
jgi:hypothetical protein